MIRLLIVDDSAFIRRSLEALLKKHTDIEIVGTASNGLEAIAKIKELDPDVVTMDVEMPKMDGLTALKRIMEENPLPVIMLSSLTQEGAGVTFKSLEVGAVDFIGKPVSSQIVNGSEFENELYEKIKAVSRRKAFLRLVYRNKQRRIHKATLSHVPPLTTQCLDSAYKADNTAPVPLTFSGRSKFDIVTIGVSTGGPPAVQKILTALPANFPVPIVIAQHMPAAFTGPFAKRLDSLCAIAVKEAEPFERLKSGVAYVCPGGKHLRIENRSGTLTGVITEEPKSALYKPSANVLMETAGEALGRRALGVMLTGMGSDGVEGAKILKNKGGRMLTQSEETCVVYGMPKAVVDANLSDEVVAIDDMAAAILRQLTS